MFYFLKSMLRKLVDTPAEANAIEQASQPAAHPEPRPVPQQPRNGNGAYQNGRGIDIPLQAILTGLPLELQPKVKQAHVGEMTISVPLEKILSQLSRGNVKISFRELRQAAPAVFSSDRDRDAVLVVLPLGEILVRLNPALIARRRVQRQIVVPAEISSPFDARGQGLVLSNTPNKAEPVSARHSNGTPAPVVPAAPAAPVVQPVPQRASITSAPTPPPPAALPPGPALIPGGTRTFQKPIANKQATPQPSSQTSLHSKPPFKPPTPSPITPKAPVPTPVTPRVPTPSPAPKLPVPSPAAAAAPLAPPQPVLPGQEKLSGETLVLGLTALAEAWPEAVRHEVVQLNLVDAKVALPTEHVEHALKTGRIAFSWKTLRSWIRPAPLPTVSAHDGTVLELPLKIVAPLFLARKKEASTGQTKVSIDDDIPNLFFGFPQGDGNGTPAPIPASSGNTPPPIRTSQTGRIERTERTERPQRPQRPDHSEKLDTNYYVWDDSSDTVRFQAEEVKQGPSAGTRFVTKYATPNEVVSRAASLDGVAGALIALPDGLMVASRLPADLNGETLAAFLPHIFGKVSQCTKELRMGELNNLSFTVGNVPWKIFRVNAIFFAAFGRAGEAMSTSDLAALAGELDHKK
jgi:predicted regulator of Ras-like GTPase activity (Roadblock/LC7/MglB family)